MAVILYLFAEPIGQARESAHAHSHAQVLSLNIGRADMFRSGLPLMVAVRHPMHVAVL